MHRRREMEIVKRKKKLSCCIVAGISFSMRFDLCCLQFNEAASDSDCTISTFAKHTQNDSTVQATATNQLIIRSL